MAFLYSIQFAKITFPAKGSKKANYP